MAAPAHRSCWSALRAVLLLNPQRSLPLRPDNGSKWRRKQFRDPHRRHSQRDARSFNHLCHTAGRACAWCREGLQRAVGALFDFRGCVVADAAGVPVFGEGGQLGAREVHDCSE